MRQIFLVICVILSTNATAQETVLMERSATERVGNWYLTNQSAAQINAFADEQNARPIDIDVVGTNPLRFDVSFVSDSGVHEATWNWRYDMNEAGLNAFAERTNSRVIDLETYMIGNERRFAAVFRQNSGSDAVGWRWGYGMTRDGLRNVYNRYDMRIVDIERYVDGGTTLYAAVMVDNTGARETDWFWFRDQTLDGVVANMRRTGMRVLDMERHGTGRNTRYTTVLVPFSPGQRAWHYYGITQDEVTHMAVRHSSRVIDLERGPNGRFDVQLLDNGLNQSGDCDGRLSHFGDGLAALMKREAIPGAQIAVVKDNRLVYSCAYGVADVDTLERVTPQSLFRIMSVSKLLTKSALLHLEKAGDLDLDDPMLIALGKLAPKGPPADPRLTHTTVKHLMDMEGGFVPSDRYDPTLSQPSVAADMGVTAPVSCFAITQYVIENFELSYFPGGGRNRGLSDATRYSNLSYCILQQIVRAVSGDRYQTYVRNEILRPAGVTAMSIGRGRQSERKDGEVTYYDQPFAAPISSQYPADAGPVPRPYSFVVEAMAGHGGWIASANDLVRYAAYTPTDPGSSTTFYGALNGTRSVLKEVGDVYVAIVWNASPVNSGWSVVDEFGGLVEDGVDAVTTWPARDLWANYGYP